MKATMYKFKQAICLLFLMFSVSFVKAQISTDNGLNMPGGYNSFTNPPTDVNLSGAETSGGNFIVNSHLLFQRIYQTTFLAASSGGDIVGGNYNFLFTSGLTSDPYSNKWGGVASWVKDDTNSVFYGSCESNNNVTFTNGDYYTVNWWDQGYSNTQAVIMETSGSPVAISSVNQTPTNTACSGAYVTVNISLSSAPSAQENFYVRYSTNSFTTSGLAKAVISGSNATALIPPQSPSAVVQYYVFSSTVDSANIVGNYDLCTIKINSNNGSYYSYNVICPPPTDLAVSNIQSNTALVTWHGSPCAFAYIERHRVIDSTKWTPYVVVGAADSSWTIQALTPGTNYEVQVQTYCDSLHTDSTGYTASVDFTSTAILCTSPTNLAAVSVTGTSATLSWSDTQVPIGFQIQYRASTASKWSGATARGTASSVTIYNLTPNTTYYWIIRAKCNSGFTGYSNQQTFTTLPPSGIKPPTINNGSTNADDVIPNLDNFTAFPNPTTGNVTVKGTFAISVPVKIQIFNLLGQLVYSSDEGTVNGDFTKTISLGNLPSSLYVVHMIYGNESKQISVSRQDY